MPAYLRASLPACLPACLFAFQPICAPAFAYIIVSVSRLRDYGRHACGSMRELYGGMILPQTCNLPPAMDHLAREKANPPPLRPSASNADAAKLAGKNKT